MAWGEKAWQFAAAMSEEAFVAAAIADLGYLGFAFAYAVDRRTGRSEAFQALTPFAAGTTVAGVPEGGKSTFYHPSGYILIENRPRKLAVRLRAFKADVALADVQPWDATWPIEGGGYNRTQKAMGLPAKGHLELGGERLSLDGHGLSDWTRGAPARETSWRWAAGVGRAGDRVVAWNLRTGFDDPTGEENCIWVDGEPHGVGPATIEIPADETQTWRVAGGDLALSFKEQGDRHENLDLILIASRYRQPWGTYVGTHAGVPLTGFGVTEDHWARW